MAPILSAEVNRRSQIVNERGSRPLCPFRATAFAIAPPGGDRFCPPKIEIEIGIEIDIDFDLEFFGRGKRLPPPGDSVGVAGMWNPPRLLLLALLFASPASAQDGLQAVACAGRYDGHLQGVATNKVDTLWWSWTTALVKTDRAGQVLGRITVPSHAGDLTYRDGKVYVAFNFGRFNQPEGEADSWIVVYDGDTLAELERHAIPELIHGAGGIAHHGDRFVVVGGLPVGAEENLVYEYDLNFVLLRRHTLPTGYTRLGIQTIEYADGAWWLGCYGNPRGQPGVLLRTDGEFRLTGRWAFSAGIGLAHLGDGRFLVGHNQGNRQDRYRGWLEAARLHPERGLVLE